MIIAHDCPILAILIEIADMTMLIPGRSVLECPTSLAPAIVHRPLVMSIGNQEFGIPRKYQNQIGIWYLCPKFLGIFLVFCRYLECGYVKIWFNIGILPQNKNRFGFGFLWLSFHWYRFGFGLIFSWKWHLWPTRRYTGFISQWFIHSLT